jgi:hypothetical protein
MSGSELKPQDAGQVLKSCYDNIYLNLKTSSQNSFIKAPFDYISVAYPTSTTETYTYKFGGALGTIVGIITVTYTDATKENLSSALGI